MKSVMINDIVYSVGDEIYLIKDGADLSKIGVGNYKDYINKLIITKITPSGYIYVKENTKFAYEFKLNKDGSYTAHYPKRVLIPYSEEIEYIYNRCEMEHDYIQNTFKRLKLVKSLSYNTAQKINSLLDELGIDKVEQG